MEASKRPVESTKHYKRESEKGEAWEGFLEEKDFDWTGALMTANATTM